MKPLTAADNGSPMQSNGLGQSHLKSSSSPGLRANSDGIVTSSGFFAPTADLRAEQPSKTAADALFEAGLRHHQPGRLVDAENAYRRTFAAHPNHADALHLLGVIACQAGRPDVAVQLIELAILQDGKNSLLIPTMALLFNDLSGSTRRWNATSGR